jgi:catechol 2,3-dioxygenase-like lactoylglutathione lyase family enzyme
MNTAPALVGVNHLTLPVGDLGVAEHFYVELLGLELVRRVDAMHIALRCGAVELHLFQESGHHRTKLEPHPHLAFEVDLDAFARFQARLAQHGVAYDGPRRLGPPGHASIYFPDPWGNLLELATFSHPGGIPIGPPDLRALEAAQGVRDIATPAPAASLGSTSASISTF